MPERDKSLESWIWAAACSIRTPNPAKYREYILPLIFVKRLCDVYDDELTRIAKEVGSRAKAFKLVDHDKKLVRFYLPLQPKNPDDSVWSVIRTLSTQVGEQLTTYLRAVGDANPLLKGIVDRVDFNATTHGERDMPDDRLASLIERISEKRLGLADVEPDIIGRSYEYLISKFAEDTGKSSGELYTPAAVGFIMARIMDPEPGLDCYDPTCGSAGLLIKLRLVHDEKQRPKMGTVPQSGREAAGTVPIFVSQAARAEPVKLYGQEVEPGSWAMANMNMIIHDMEGKIELGDTFRNPKFRRGNRLQTFDRVVANPMWNQDWFREQDYDADELGRFPKGAGFPGNKADWGWMQHILASLNDEGRAAVVLDTGAASRGSGNANTNKEKQVRKWFIEQDLIEGVIYLPENLFYNTSAPGIIIFLNRAKPADRKGKLFLLNASNEFEKGDPKNYIPDEAVIRIADTFKAWREVEKYSRIVPHDEIVKNDYNTSPSRYVHTGATEGYRSIAAIFEELYGPDGLEEEAAKTNEVLKDVLRIIKA